MQNQAGGRIKFSYAWIILGVLFIGMVTSFGMRSSFGAYISPWEYEFSVSRTTVTAISTMSFVFFGVGMPVAGKLNDYIGKNYVPAISIFIIGLSLVLTAKATQIWHVFFSYGVLFSIGVAGTSHSVSTPIISNWFVEKRGLALGLMTSGMAIGMLIFGPANLFVIEELGWRTAMVVFGIIVMVVAGPLFIFLLRAKPEDKGMKPYGYKAHEGIEEKKSLDEGSKQDENKKLPVLGIFKTRAFWFLAIPYFICGFTDVGLINVHLIPMAEGRGFAVGVVALAISLIAISNIAGTIVTGHLSDHFSRKRQLAVIYGFRAVTYVLLILMQQPWMILLFAVGYGAVEMASIAPTNSLAVQLFDKYSTGTIVGFIAVSHQLGGAAGSWIPGIMYDATGAYTIVLAVSIVTLVGISLMSLGLPEPKKVKKLS
ncbi:MAG: MFS transporter [Oscillospiraceae bacterium]|nr:MFS transporter [Oscillospiraceae bacterium]